MRTLQEVNEELELVRKIEEIKDVVDSLDKIKAIQVYYSDERFRKIYLYNKENIRVKSLMEAIKDYYRSTLESLMIEYEKKYGES